MWTRFETMFLTIMLNNLMGNVYSRTITCLCTTSECEEQSTTVCTTAGQCYSQFLDLKDGSNPLTRGCIASKTPLLCENRRPAINASWPVLVCCSTNMCNQDAMPTPAPAPKLTPEKYFSTSGLNASDSSTTSGSAQKSAESPLEIRPVTSSNSSQSDDQATSSGKNGAGISPAYVAVLVVGICSLAVIALVALFVLRKQGRLYDGQYGAMERNSYLKGHQAATREDPELQMPLPRAANGIYDNKITVGT